MNNEKKFEQIMIKIAKRHRTTPQNVRRDLQEVIDMGWANPDPVIHARWLLIGKGRKPTVQELVSFSAGVARNC